MRLEDQVCSLDVAERLKELNVKQDSLFTWVETLNFGTKIFPADFSFDLDLYGSVRRLASAFTVAELGELLPRTIVGVYRATHPEEEFYLEEKLSTKGMYKLFYESELGQYTVMSEDTNEANARAKMLIYVLENASAKEGGESHD